MFPQCEALSTTVKVVGLIRRPRSQRRRLAAVGEGRVGPAGQATRRIFEVICGKQTPCGQSNTIT